jgi:hypothetical protein
MVLKHCRFYRFVLAELAIDFGPRSDVDGAFVRRHALFGKSRRRTDRGGPGQLRYGSRKSGKLVRCYWKSQVNAFRVELEIHSQLLKRHRIEVAEDLAGVIDVIRPKHLRFVRLDWKRLEAHLERRFSPKHQWRIRKARALASRSLQKTFRFLRGQGVHNVHRFTREMRINRAVENALFRWSEDFRKELSWRCTPRSSELMKRNWRNSRRNGRVK